MTKPGEDEIVAEFHRHRQAHAESLDFDLKRITADLQREERESGTPVVQRPPREPQPPPKRSSG